MRKKVNSIAFGIFIAQYLYYRKWIRFEDIQRAGLVLQEYIDFEEYFKHIKYNSLRTFLHKNPLQKMFRNVFHFNQEKQTSVPHGPLCYWVKRKRCFIYSSVIIHYISPLCLKIDQTICHQIYFTNLEAVFCFSTSVLLLQPKTLSIW